MWAWAATAINTVATMSVSDAVKKISDSPVGFAVGFVAGAAIGAGVAVAATMAAPAIAVGLGVTAATGSLVAGVAASAVTSVVTGLVDKALETGLARQLIGAADAVVKPMTDKVMDGAQKIPVVSAGIQAVGHTIHAAGDGSKAVAAVGGALQNGAEAIKDLRKFDIVGAAHAAWQAVGNAASAVKGVLGMVDKSIVATEKAAHALADAAGVAGLADPNAAKQSASNETQGIKSEFGKVTQTYRVASDIANGARNSWNYGANLAGVVNENGTRDQSVKNFVEAGKSLAAAVNSLGAVQHELSPAAQQAARAAGQQAVGAGVTRVSQADPSHHTPATPSQVAVATGQGASTGRSTA